MIDLALLNEVKVDPQAKTAVAGGGAKWGALDAATQAHGLAVTGGRVPSTGIGGLTLGSGSGWLERKLGYTVDNMIGAEVVLASGDIVHASESENPDLFWGLRGGGGNYGIVTKFEYRPPRDRPDGLRRHARLPALLALRRSSAPTATSWRTPRTTSAVASRSSARRPSEFVPEPMHGMPIVGIIVCYTGQPREWPRRHQALPRPPARDEHDSADALPRGPEADRSRQPAGHAAVLEGRHASRASRRGDRGAGHGSRGTRARQ